MSGIPVVVVETGGLPVTSVESGAPVMTVSENGFGMPITLVDNAAPFIIEGIVEGLLALSSDDGSPLADDDAQVMETY